MALPGVLKQYPHIVYRAILSILASATALAWKARAQEVQPLYGVPISSEAPMPHPSVLYGPPPAPILPSPSPAPTQVPPTPVPNLANIAMAPLTIIAIAISILIVVVCAWVGLTWLLRRGKDRK